jgi:predicted PurR-regulated permease PerM
MDNVAGNMVACSKGVRMIDSGNGRAELSQFAIDLLIRLALLAGILYGSLLLLRPIGPIVLWSIILTVAVFPLFSLLRRRLHLQQGVAAALLAFILLALLLVPAAMLGISAVDTLELYARQLVAGQSLLPPPPESIRDWPLVGQRLHDLWLRATNDTRAILSTHVPQIASLGLCRSPEPNGTTRR